MVKLLTFFNLRQDKTREECLEYWNTQHSELLKANLPLFTRYVANTQLPIKSQEWLYDGYSEIWFDSMEDLDVALKSEGAKLLKDDFDQFARHLDWMVVEEAEEEAIPWAADANKERMVKITAFVITRKDKDYDECVTYWKEQHKGVVQEYMPLCKRYITNHKVPYGGAEYFCDGFGELWFNSTKDVGQTFAPEPAAIIHADEDQFSLPVQWLLVVEKEVVPSR